MRRWALGLVVTVAAAGLGGCAPGRGKGFPTCRQTDTLVLMAQSVPSAERVPCIAAFPVGWQLHSVSIRSGRSFFTIDSDRAGPRAVQVVLKPECDVQGSTEIATDEPGTRRYERVTTVVGGFTGTRYYTFPGGCVEYRFNFRSAGMALVNEVSLALGFTTRAALADEVARSTGGVARL